MITLKKLFIGFISVATLSLAACSDDDTSSGNLTLNLTNLEDLGSSYQYENWIIVDGAPVSAGLFTVNSKGQLSQNSFNIPAASLENATAFVLTIEPLPDPDPAPSDVHILAGDFAGTSANLSVGHAAALGNDFTASSGSYILATPTDGGSTNDENSGVWWLDPNGGPAATLTLPDLPAGWKYEGWAVINGTPLSTGKFTSVSGADDGAPYSGATAGPPFPGEDFLVNAPSGLSFPTDLAGTTVVVSIEPEPDNSTAPFLLKPLVASVPANATDHTLYSMDNNAAATNPGGTASR